MAAPEVAGFYILITLITIFFSIILYHFSSKSGKSTRNWPIVGIVPSLLLNAHRFHDKITEVLQENNGFILVKCDKFVNRNILFTSDPAIVNHIMCTNFVNYPKGTEWRKRFDVFGDAMFNSDFDEWTNHRKVVRMFFSQLKFHQFVDKIIQDCMDNELIPVLDHLSDQRISVDLQLLLQRHFSHFAYSIAVGCKAKSFDVASPEEEEDLDKAIGEACEAILVRHVLPEVFWKLQQWLGLGREKKLRDARETFDRVFADFFSKKQKEMIHPETIPNDEEDFSALKMYMTGHVVVGKEPTHHLMRDNIIGLIFAAQDTTSTALCWFFWIVSKNPDVETKIKSELDNIINFERGKNANSVSYSTEGLSKMVYLHAALCETLRLYPPVPYQSRTPVNPDILPSGHKIDRRTSVILCTYAMGRMSSVWGEDCHEFKPERWILENGSGIRREPSHKFFAFNAGPRICPGINFSFRLLKSFASTIIHNYHVTVVENHPVTAKTSIVLQMRHGLMVRITKRSDVLN